MQNDQAAQSKARQTLLNELEQDLNEGSKFTKNQMLECLGLCMLDWNSETGELSTWMPDGTERHLTENELNQCMEWLELS